MSRAIFCLTVLVTAAACGPQESPQAGDTPAATVPIIAGRLADPALDEASGIAASLTYPGVFWVVNDGGKARLYAVDGQGRSLGRVTIDSASNRDWEDVAAFVHNDTPYLLIADIGDNEAKRADVRVYVVHEPEPGAVDADIAWQFDFRYPDGPRDAEALAVDAQNEQILVLSKRDVPAVLYSLPLRPADNATATRLDDIRSLPQPGQQDIEFAPTSRYWWWQPTAMDIAAGGRAAVILTYRGIYLYRRTGSEDWLATLQRQPDVLYAGSLDTAEAVAFSPDATSVYITFEGRNSPFLRIDLNGAIEK